MVGRVEKETEVDASKTVYLRAKCRFELYMAACRVLLKCGPRLNIAATVYILRSIINPFFFIFLVLRRIDGEKKNYARHTPAYLHTRSVSI